MWCGKACLHMPKETRIKKAMERGEIQAKRNYGTGEEMWHPIPRKRPDELQRRRGCACFQFRNPWMMQLLSDCGKYRHTVSALLNGTVQHAKKSDRKAQNESQCYKKGT